MDEVRFTSLQKQLKALFLKEGSKVRIKGTQHVGEVIHIEKDFNKINWHGAKPYFILIMTDEGKQVMASPTQLKRVGKA